MWGPRDGRPQFSPSGAQSSGPLQCVASVYLGPLHRGNSFTEATNQDETVTLFRSRREFEGAHH